ncbi:hypothetical protein ASE95_05020 [Sphingomonas sp. Leaf231]|uniref:hypothetical protein n=1 Tax=Sphingomonas sp. Leaf231 TaxID=1736301 RepID=UPI0006F27CD3|nr:hypothetical protein [Sphingomonas sp. Leaf231]KQN94218.1 hypothetical protein ASE95_05020 [Sphingomonas sp. Leaf231]
MTRRTPPPRIRRFERTAVFIGTADSDAQGRNLLKMPAYVTTDVLHAIAPTRIDEDRIPASHIVRGRAPPAARWPPRRD